jgi:glycosyltransferase involved in cell wall biosynthesis
LRIAYACYWDVRRRDGVTSKISQQLAAWRAAGHEATLFLLCPAPDTDSGDPIEAEAFPFGSAFSRLRATRSLYAAVKEARPDLIYLRYDLFVPPPSSLAGMAPTVVEVNSNLQAELVARSRGAAAYERFQAPGLFRHAAGAVCVSNELAQVVRSRQPHIPVTVIANGVDLGALSPLPPSREIGIRAVYLGDDPSWQGVDKLIAVAPRLPDWHIDLIGVTSEQSLPTVTFHGFLPRREYEPILARADLAFGTLALHRKQMNETSALKVPTYLAYGLPTIIGYADTNFVDSEPWYLLRLPNTESNVRDSLERIRSFAQEVKGRRVPRDEVAERISTRSKEAARLAFFTAVLTGRHKLDDAGRPVVHAEADEPGARDPVDRSDAATVRRP